MFFCFTQISVILTEMLFLFLTLSLFHCCRYEITFASNHLIRWKSRDWTAEISSGCSSMIEVRSGREGPMCWILSEGFRNKWVWILTSEEDDMQLFCGKHFLSLITLKKNKNKGPSFVYSIIYIYNIVH